MIKWEYKTAKIEVFNGYNFSNEYQRIEEIMSTLGNDNWELVSTQGIVTFEVRYPYTKELILFFKRPIAE